MKDSNPSRHYLDDEKRQYMKVKAELITQVSNYRKLLNDCLIERGDRVQYEVNEINGYHCQFKLINHVLVDLNQDRIEYNLTGDIKPTTHQVNELYQKGDQLYNLVIAVSDAKRSMRAGAQHE